MTSMIYRSIFIVLLIIFTLKITNVITASWWWILTPIWMPLLFAITIILSLIIADCYFSITTKKNNDEN